MSQRSAAVLLIAIAALPVLLYLPFLAGPWIGDEGVFATIAQGVLRGELPYRDAFDHKPPLVYGWYALAFLAPGDEAVAVRLAAALAWSLSAVLLYVQARLSLGAGAALLAAGAFALSADLVTLNWQAGTDVFMLPPLVGSLLALSIGRRRADWRWLALAGGLAALAVLTKPIAVLNAIVLLGALLPLARRAPSRAELVPALSFVAGGALVAAVVVAPFAASGALGDFLYANVGFNLDFGSSVTLAQRGERALRYGLVYFPLVAGPWVLGSLLGLGAIARGPRRPGDLLLVAWLAASVAGVAAAGPFFPHYFLQLLPAAALLSGRAAASVGELRLAVPAGRRLLAGTMAALLPLAFLANAPAYAQPTPLARQVAKSILQVPPERVGERAALGAYVREHSDPGDSVYVHGSDPALYFYIGRRPATRDFFPVRLSSGAAPALRRGSRRAARRPAPLRRRLHRRRAPGRRRGALRAARRALRLRRRPLLRLALPPATGVAARPCASRTWCEPPRGNASGTRRVWSGGRVSNPRPSAWKADALPAELPPQRTASA